VLLSQNAYKSDPITPWGIEVKKRLLDRRQAKVPPCSQNDIIKHLNSKGFVINKSNLTFLLKGVGVKNRTAEIEEINTLLGIIVLDT